jgi:hypothetical protein
MNIMSEVELIGQRMSQHLLASGWLESVEIELQEKSLVLTLFPDNALGLSPQYERIMRFCLNFLGDSMSHALTSSVFPWCAAHVGGVFPDRACPIWINCSHLCGYIGIDVLCELILLGLRLSQSLSLSPIAPQDFHPEDLLQVYRTKEEVLDFYEQFITHVIQAGDDLPTKACDTSLRSLWLCCPKHRFLFLQRLMLNGWLHHIAWEWKLGQEYSELPDTEYLLEVPTVVRQIMQARGLRVGMKQTSSPPPSFASAEENRGSPMSPSLPSRSSSA